MEGFQETHASPTNNPSNLLSAMWMGKVDCSPIQKANLFPTNVFKPYSFTIPAERTEYLHFVNEEGDKKISNKIVYYNNIPPSEQWIDRKTVSRISRIPQIICRKSKELE